MLYYFSPHIFYGTHTHTNLKNDPTLQNRMNAEKKTLWEIIWHIDKKQQERTSTIGHLKMNHVMIRKNSALFEKLKPTLVQI